jgi:hypothetical protein
MASPEIAGLDVSAASTDQYVFAFCSVIFEFRLGNLLAEVAAVLSPMKA